MLNNKTLALVFVILVLNLFCYFNICCLLYAQDIKLPNVAGVFYPDDPQELARMVDGFLEKADPAPAEGEVFALISAHAGYGYSGQVAAYGYKLIKDKPYKTVIIIGPSHQYAFSGVSVYPDGFWRTPLGDLAVDKDFTQKILAQDKEIIFDARAFEKEHSVEVQLPFLQRSLREFKIVPIVMGDCSFSACQKLADLLREAIGSRQDILVVASSDMYHGYDYREADRLDCLTLGYLRNMDAQGLYYALREAKAQLCGGFPVVSAMLLAKQLGHRKLTLLRHTNSAEVTQNKTKGAWTVGYATCAIDQPEGETAMLNQQERKRLLEIARNSIEEYLRIGKKIGLDETNPVLTQELGAFVTLHKRGQLRGCIGNIVGNQPLYLTIKDMAIEAATGDPRFPAVELSELKDIEIEISVLSALERVDSVEKIQMGKHGVLVKKGLYSGVFLPQVATETGWSKEKFLSHLCAQKAGLSVDAWKDKATEIYIFTAEVFSENSLTRF